METLTLPQNKLPQISYSEISNLKYYSDLSLKSGDFAKKIYGQGFSLIFIIKVEGQRIFWTTCSHTGVLGQFTYEALILQSSCKWVGSYDAGTTHFMTKDYINLILN